MESLRQEDSDEAAVNIELSIMKSNDEDKEESIIYFPKYINYCYLSKYGSTTPTTAELEQLRLPYATRSPLAMIGWLGDDMRMILKGYENFLNGMFLNEENNNNNNNNTSSLLLKEEQLSLTSILKLHSIILSSFFHLPPCRGIQILNLFKYYKMKSSKLKKLNKNNIDLKSNLDSELCLFVCFGQLICKFLKDGLSSQSQSQNSNEKNNSLCFSLHELQESGSVPWLLPDIKMNNNNNNVEHENGMNENVLNVINVWYNNLKTSSLINVDNFKEQSENIQEIGKSSSTTLQTSAVQTTTTEVVMVKELAMTESTDFTMKLMNRIDDYISQSLICASQCEVYADIPHFNSMAVPLFATYFSHSSSSLSSHYLLLASLTRSHALIPSIMSNVTNWRAAANNGNGNGGSGDGGGGKGGLPSLARSVTLMEREELWADVSNRVDKMQVYKLFC